MLLRAPIVSLSGMDGCGKTTIINTLRRELSKRGIESRYVWLRYNHYFTRALLTVCRITGLTKYERIGGVRIGYHEFYRSKIVSHLFILLTLLDTLLATLVTVYIPAAVSRRVIICDRWVADILVDLEIDTRIPFDANWAYRKALIAMVPKRAKCFLVQRKLDDLLRARRENAIDRNFAQRRVLYQKLVSENLLDVVENNTTVGAAVGRIMTALGAIRDTELR